MRYFVKVQMDTILIYHSYFRKCGRWDKAFHSKSHPNHDEEQGMSSNNAFFWIPKMMFKMLISCSPESIHLVLKINYDVPVQIGLWNEIVYRTMEYQYNHIKTTHWKNGLGCFLCLFAWSILLFMFSIQPNEAIETHVLQCHKFTLGPMTMKQIQRSMTGGGWNWPSRKAAIAEP